MLINGFWPRDSSELNWVFHIQASSPAIRTQADGYPGIPIIGRQELNEYRKKIVKKNKQAAKNVLGLYYNKKEHIVQKNDN